MTACGFYHAGYYCGEEQGTRQYLPGPRCPQHTPAVVAGRVDHVPNPAWTLVAMRQAAGVKWGFNPNDTALKDERARKLGQRASGKQRRAAHG
jgi:hypothetical protein